MPAFEHPFEVAVRRPPPAKRLDLRQPLAKVAEWFGLPCPQLYVGPRHVHAAGPGTVVLGADDLDLPADELEALLAHECGHLALGHWAIDAAAHPEWAQASELSADRAAALFAGSADAIIRVIFREAARADVHSGPSASDIRIREVQAWTATAGFARLAP